MSFAHVISAQAHVGAADVKATAGGRAGAKTSYVRESLGIAGRPTAASAGVDEAQD